MITHTTIEMREIQGSAGFYITKFGNVYKGFQGREISQDIYDGELCVKLRNKKKYRQLKYIVARTWLDKPDHWQMLITHNDGDNMNCAFDNLTYKHRDEI